MWQLVQHKTHDDDVFPLMHPFQFANVFMRSGAPCKIPKWNVLLAGYNSRSLNKCASVCVGVCVFARVRLLAQQSSGASLQITTWFL